VEASHYVGRPVSSLPKIAIAPLPYPFSGPFGILLDRMLEKRIGSCFAILMASQNEASIWVSSALGDGVGRRECVVISAWRSRQARSLVQSFQPQEVAST
jgi:hypothetical protein